MWRALPGPIEGGLSHLSPVLGHIIHPLISSSAKYNRYPIVAVIMYQTNFKPRGGTAMHHIAALAQSIVAVVLSSTFLFFSEAVAAQTANYELIPTGSIPQGNSEVYNALRVDHVNNKAIPLAVTISSNNTLSFQWAGQLSPLGPGKDIQTLVPGAGNPFALGPNSARFWQIDRTTGATYFCALLATFQCTSIPPPL